MHQPLTFKLTLILVAVISYKVPQHIFFFSLIGVTFRLEKLFFESFTALNAD